MSVPERDSRVVILGAGPAGVHMARCLLRRGFTDVTILEKTDRVGGKSLTVEHDGELHELGTAYLNPDYIEVINLLKEYDLDDRVPYEGRTVWLPPGHEEGDEIAFEDWIVEEARLSLRDMPQSLRDALPEEIPDLVPDWMADLWPDKVVGLFIVGAIARYNRIHKRLLGDDYVGLLPPEPSDEVLEEIEGSFLDFLKRSGLSILVPIFMMTQTVQGYGYLDTVPALYGLMWNSPAVMKVMRNRLLGREGNDYWVLRSGWQNLWERMVERDGINVALSQDVRKIVRHDDRVELTVIDRRSGAGASPRTVTCDHLVVACPAPATLHFLDTTDEEWTLFSDLKAASFTSTLYTSTHQPGKRYLDSWFHELNTRQQHTLYSQRQTAAAGHPELADVPTGTTKARVAAQYGEAPVQDPAIASLFNLRLAQHGARNVTVHAQKRFKYFYRFSDEGIAQRYPWRIQDLQGKNRTWFVGSSVSFESVNNVVNYNLRLLERLLPASDEDDTGC
ncbi:MAG: putative NAD/FAD-dependent oxidoreductase [Myxococcota bacterium]|jgi:predicted NAD/FAD-dependent oxidoreductase